MTTPGKSPSGTHTLSSAQRLARRRDFDEAYSSGRDFAGRYVVIHLRDRPDACRRLGVVASQRTFPRAVDRNRARRLMREVFRRNRHRLAGRQDIVMVARGRIISVTFEEIWKEFETLARRAGILNSDATPS